MPLIDQDRVVEIVAIGTPESRSGTGYLLCNGCVLTAQHVIEGHANKEIKCRQLGRYRNGQTERTAAEVVWEDAALDLALLRVTWKPDGNTCLPKVRKIDLDQDVRCRAYGFPKFMKEKQQEITTYNPYVVQGRIKPLASKKQGELHIDIEGANPGDMDGWKGISGAAIFSEDDGYLVGVVTEGPKALSGGLLKGMTIENAIAADPNFAACIKEFCQQELQCLDIEKANALETFELELELAALKVTKEVNATRYELAIEDKQSCLSNLNQRGQDDSVLSSLPKCQLLRLLSDIETSSKEIFWEAWRCSPASDVTKNDIPVKQAYAILWSLKDSTQVHNFLSILYQLLDKQGSQNNYLEPLTKLTKAVCGQAINQSLNLIKETEPVLVGGSLLIKIKSFHSPNDSSVSYKLTVWLIRNRQIYQERFRKSENQAVDLSGFSEKLVNGLPIEIASGNPDIQATVLKRELSTVVTELWENRSLGIQKLKPEVIFCVPMQLLEVDFQNVELGELSVLGLELPVSVSCLERYENETLSKYRQSWLDRWQVLEDFHDEYCSSHLETHDVGTVDITCPRRLRKWLLQKDEARKSTRRVAGMGFYLPYNELSKVFRNLLINGLPIVFWPKHSLSEPGINDLRNSLKVIPSNTLVAVKKYRIDSQDNDDAGPISILLDNPYLPPPDCEIDYY
jgi:hypothetical protein